MTARKFSEIAADTAALKAEQKRLKEEAIRRTRPLFKEAFDAFFAENPQVQGIMWAQYTPYFNDGDTCEFGVRGASFVMKEGYDFERDGFAYRNHEELGIFDTWDFKDSEFANLKPICESMENYIDGSDYDLLLSMFGDHVMVYIGRNDQDFTVAAYEHD